MFKTLSLAIAFGLMMSVAGLGQLKIPDDGWEIERVPSAPTGPGALDSTLDKVTPLQALYACGYNPADQSSFLYRIRSYDTNPVAEAIVSVGAVLFDIAFDPTTGRLYGIDKNGRLLELSPNTGAYTVIASTEVAGLNALEFDAQGQAYTWDGSSGSFYRIDKQTGALTLIGNPGYSSAGDLAFDLDGTLYGTATEGVLIRINPATGAGTFVGFLDATSAFGLEIDTDGAMYVGEGAQFSAEASLYQVDKNDASGSFLGPVQGAGSLGLGGLAFLRTPSGDALRLNNARFQIEVSWETSDGSRGKGHPVQLTSDTGYFWFFSSSNVEFVIKVLNGCGVNNRYWVFAGGLTDVKTEIKVTDLLLLTTKTYANPQGTAFRPIQDTTAFASCP
jgi:hypothetical protein